MAGRLVDKVVDILNTMHGAYSGSPGKQKSARLVADEPKQYWKLDVWEDDARRRRR